MSTTELEQAEAETERRPVFVRTFSVETAISDGRTLDVRIVPFDEIAEVADPPDFRKYREQFMPGVFKHQERAADKILLRFEHTAIDERGQRKPGLAGVVGRGLSIRDGNDGYYGSFRFLDTAEADTALALVEAKVITAVSAEFGRARNGSVRTRDGVVQRRKAHLDSVSLTRNKAAYSKAAVLGLREDEEFALDEELLPPAPNRALLERCQRLGIALPERMNAALQATATENDQQ